MTKNEKIYLHMMRRQEEKLIELMGAESYGRFARELAKEAFRMEVDGMAESAFKDFVTENFDNIVGGETNGERERDIPT